MLKRLTIILIACCSFITISSAQSVPETMPYQGFLNGSDGIPVQGSVNITFKLYEEQLANAPVWEETVNNISVNDGAFSTDLGQVSTNLNEYLYSGRALYIGIAVNDSPELTPRTKLGTIPYAFLSYNAYKLEGLRAADFVTQGDLEVFEQNFQGGLNADDVNTLIDNRGYLNTDAINALIDNRNYINSNEVDQRITAAINTVNGTIGGLQTQITDLEGDISDLQTALQTLQDQVNGLQNQGNDAPFILGASAQSSNGRLQFNNQEGVRAAGEMCKATYPNDTGAHFCSLSEIQEAASIGNYNAAINGVATWVYATSTLNNNVNDCQSLLYPSAHVEAGTTVTVNTADGTVDGGVGVRMAYNINASCQVARPVLCCR